MSHEIENRTYSLKRSFYTYLAYPVFIVLFGKNVIEIDFNQFEAIDAVNIIGLVVFVLILGRIIFRPAFIKVGFDQITIYRDFFYSETILVEEIEGFEEPANPFSKAYFKTKEGKKGKFIPSNIKPSDLSLLKAILTKRGVSIE